MEAPFYSAGLIVNEIFLMGGTRNHEDLLQNSHPTIFIHRTISICSIFFFFLPQAQEIGVLINIYIPPSVPRGRWAWEREREREGFCFECLC